MQYKRREPFRYEFLDPIKGSFSLLLNQEDQKNLSKTDTGSMEILDISPRGMKFKSALNIPINKKAFLVEAYFNLENVDLNMLGKIAWKKELEGMYYYGLEGFEDDEREQHITNAVKEISKRRKDGDGLI
ncbi:PilZ domain-containing protein [Pelagirhabdus alkalitolerans]|uniref:PilZ domain-containing protein n=1 Tax=Pelagirhabdus alkalitolerans TaxID=1612202 RepID=A0A1G6IF77_9BACI|nr:PilZ domain-containing protein [Pelagirhabdus alkalitolerans]SDC05207.1 PilZ domain-containing protein [Pelagirhabdus alkalitolerans]